MRTSIVYMLRAMWMLYILLIVSVNTNAQNVSVADAMGKARMLKRGNTISSLPNNTLSGEEESVDLAYTSKDKGNTLFYVFNYADGGFAIIGGDEKAKVVLGYSDNGVFNIDSIPEGLRDMLASYSEQISYAIANNIEAPLMNMSVSKRSIATLIQTTWNQNEPFNCCIPEIGTNYPAFVAGCAPIAAAQIMKYYNYPQTGIGSRSYNITYNDPSNGFSKKITFSADFANTTYDWNNMKNSYSSYSTSVEQQAVGKLVYHIGVAMNANYGQYGTGVYTNADLPALKNYFGYCSSATKEYRTSYSNSEWEDLIYNELAIGHPVFYAGQATDGGHAFVCDGYDSSNDLYHFNWGWGGYCDGYYPLTGIGALQPNGSGIGGAGTGSAYTSDQYVLIGLCPPSQEIPVTDITLSQTFASINEGNTLTLSATVLPANATNKSVNWSSSDTSVATVSSDGLVTAIKAGGVTITATAADGSGKKSSCILTIKAEVPSTTVTIKFTSGSISVYDSNELSDIQMSKGSVSDKIIVNLGSGTQYAYEVSEIADILFEEKDSDNPSSPVDDGVRHNGYEYVDLGLSVKWATCNVGAEKMSDIGSYFAWAETETKTNYSKETHKYYSTSIETYIDNDGIEQTKEYKGYTKYVLKSASSSLGYKGFYDDRNTLELVDDVAHVKWGGNWRMPTNNELKELSDNCTMIYTTINGIDGVKLISKKQGYTDKFIFLPSTGIMDGTKLRGQSSRFWSSSIVPSDNNDQGAVYLSIPIYGSSPTYGWSSMIGYGVNVRPVLPK